MKFTQRLKLFWTSFSSGMTVVTLGYLVLVHFFPRVGVRMLACCAAEIFWQALVVQVLLVGNLAWPLWVRRLSCLFVQAWVCLLTMSWFGYVSAENVWRMTGVLFGFFLLVGPIVFWLADRAERRRIARINAELARMQGREE